MLSEYHLPDKDIISKKEDASMLAKPTIKSWDICTVVWFIFFFACLGLAITNLVVSLFKWDVHLWFRTATTEDLFLFGNESDTVLDEKLHLLSRWDGMNASQWISFVHHAYDPLSIQTKNLTFLEIGIGVGAWTRVFLREFPNATGVGIDLEQNVLDIARQTLRNHQVKLMKMNMIAVPMQFQNFAFDYVFIPGTLCYADSLSDVYHIVNGLFKYNVLRIGGKMSITMLASDTSETGSCVTRISKRFWNKWQDQIKVVAIEDMDSWNLPHALGRYAVFLERVA